MGFTAQLDQQHQLTSLNNMGITDLPRLQTPLIIQMNI